MKVDVAIRLDGTPDGVGQCREDVGCEVVDDRVNRVQTQSVEMVFGQPVEWVVDEEVPHDLAVEAIEVDAVAALNGLVWVCQRHTFREITLVVIGFHFQATAGRIHLTLSFAACSSSFMAAMVRAV
jgi:hypothetical protein